MVFVVNDLVADSRDPSCIGTVCATNSDYDHYAATVVSAEEPLIYYDPSIQHIRKRFIEWEYRPPTGTLLIKWRSMQFPMLVLAANVRLLGRVFAKGCTVVHAADGHQQGTVIRTKTSCDICTVGVYAFEDRGSLAAHFPTVHLVKELTSLPVDLTPAAPLPDNFLTESAKIAVTAELQRTGENRIFSYGLSGGDVCIIGAEVKVHQRTAHLPSQGTIMDLVGSPSINRASPSRITETLKPALVRNLDLADLHAEPTWNRGDAVVYGDWAGIVTSTGEEVTLRLSNGSAVVLPPRARIAGVFAQSLYSSYHVGDMVALRKADLRLGRWVFGAYDPNVEPIGVILQVRTIDARIVWQTHRLGTHFMDNAEWPNIVIGFDELSSGAYRRYDEYNGTHVRVEETDSDDPVLAPDLMFPQRVRFRSVDVAGSKYSNRTDFSRLFDQGRSKNSGWDLNVYDVVDITSQVTVQWQDGTITSQGANELLHADQQERNLFPGDIVCHQDLEIVNRDAVGSNEVHWAHRVGIVQSALSRDCLVKVRWFERPRPARIGRDTRFIYDEWELGALSSTVSEASFYDLFVPEALDIGLHDLVMLKQPVMQAHDTGLRYVNNTLATNGDDSHTGNIEWFGHVESNHLDATFTIRFGMSEGYRSMRLHIDEFALAVDAELILSGASHEASYSGDEDAVMGSSEFEQDMGTIMMGDRNAEIEYIMDGVTQSLGDENDSAWSTDEEGDRATSSSDTATHSQTTANAHAVPNSAPAYLLLDANPPIGHKFTAERRSLTSQALKRVMREHTIMMGDQAIPPGIYVRSWESQCNLLRAVIIGPADTPYSHCPFVFDILLPTNFPNKPPKVHFHHWSAGSLARYGRINPNLYEDGTVCLSLINTWPGQEEEGWVPGQSTLLQVLISIQSLVLVKEPFYSKCHSHCQDGMLTKRTDEPGFDGKKDLPGTRSSVVAYSERVFLQSRGFLAYILGPETDSSSLDGVEDVLEAVYLSREGPRMLEKIIDECEELMQVTDQDTIEDKPQRNGISHLSKGACLVLKTMVEELKNILRARSVRQPTAPGIVEGVLRGLLR